ncbi:MAG: 2-oxoglutarate dehydrogenase E1 component [Gemmatimonadetes bacterium]|nr:2-oxoglutarate dehydrogenase E1 component [Gemmatimonadota bacterium]
MSERKNTKVFDSYNAGYAQSIYESFARDPASVDASWRALFGMSPEAAGLLPVRGAGGGPTRAQLRAAIAAAELVDAHRLHGHTAARLDPLGSEPRGHPMLSPEFHGIQASDLAAIPASLLDLGDPGVSMEAVLGWLRATYTGTIGYEFEHMEDPQRREWLRERIEGGEHRRPLSAEEKRRLLARLTEVEALEQFLHRAYLGQKRFSVEGNDMLVPMLDLAIERAAAAGAREVVLGMAHRGRLNVLAHVLGRPVEKILAEFEGQQQGTGTGDVKYHLGAEGTYATASGDPLTVTMAPNPSHLEFVNPVVEGVARAKQTRVEGKRTTRDLSRVLPVLMHGDAAFAGQGIVAETLNLARLRGYETGGTLHLIVNNQIGFTTDPGEARSTDYASDLARGFDLPVFHVNADDAEACLAVVRLALEFRTHFEADVLIDLVGYRRYGHNEGDEPAYTQPRMYAKVAEHPTALKQWAKALVEEGTVDEADVTAVWDRTYERLADLQRKVKDGAPNPKKGQSVSAPVEPATLEPPIPTVVEAAKLLSYDRQLHSWPDGFTPNPKLEKQLAKRSESLSAGSGIDWAHAESLAFASLVAEGTPVRLSGQDVVRGTFSQRHLMLRDVETGEGFTPLVELEEATAPFEVYNSPLSEAGAMGFEYGYSAASHDWLVLWEAQFGDFVNGAQVIVDQFLVAGRAKWGEEARLVLLLPHGYEGQGPEHSSARLERFLQLAAEDNIRVANCTTPAQYFHLLRRQARLEEIRPLVVFTPKSLLRHPRAVSTLEDLAEGRFRLILDDERAREAPEKVRRVVLCTGKLYYDLVGGEERESGADVAVVRMEQLYPFPDEALRDILERYGSATELIWAQEEPANMGAWSYMAPWLHELGGDRLAIGYVGRPERASPAEGYKKAHDEQQARIVRDAFGEGAELPRSLVARKTSQEGSGKGAPKSSGR